MTRRPSTRAAFTLVELLVVIAIIGVLLGLLLPAVQKIRGTGPRTTAVAEVEQLGIAAKSFNTEFKFYPPTVFVTPTVKNSNDPSFQALASMFPRWANAIAEGAPISPALGFPGTYIGGQSLVLFLGGPGGTGWAVDAPIAPSAGAVSKKGPFYDFPPNRIVNGQLLDPWKTPYIYFGSIAGGNYPGVSVSTVGPFSNSNLPAPAPLAVANFSAVGITPFYVAVGKPVNQGGCQIISAGEKMAFGPGGAWAPGSGAYVTGQPGGDDIGNFNAGKQLGVN